MKHVKAELCACGEAALPGESWCFVCGKEVKGMHIDTIGWRINLRKLFDSYDRQEINDHALISKLKDVVVGVATQHKAFKNCEGLECLKDLCRCGCHTKIGKTNKRGV